MYAREKVDDLWPLQDIAEKLKFYNMHELENVSLSQLQEWDRKSESTGFPLPARKLGRFKLYDINQIIEWIILWRRVTARMGNPDLNGGTDGEG